MRRSSTSFYLCIAYVCLAFLAMIFNIQRDIISAVSVGALLFSMSQLFDFITEANLKSTSIAEMLVQGTDKDDVALKYISEIEKMRLEREKSNHSFSNVCSILLKSIAYVVIIVGPVAITTLGIKLGDYLGSYCTVASLGTMFLSFWLNERREEKRIMIEEREIVDCFGSVYKSLGGEVKKAKEDVDELDNRVERLENIGKSVEKDEDSTDNK